jgi:molybdopterin/thiamine biosynthesis adenylyltransferase
MISGRYQRHGLIDWFSQDVLSRTKVAVIGAGAVGNEVIKNLALLGVGEIRIFDFDMIEEHNLTRSVLFRESDIGRSKAEVAAERAAAMDPNISVTASHGDFWDHLGLRALRTYDILFCCVDNFEARIRSNTLCHLAQVDFVNIGIDSRFAAVELFPLSRNSQGCLECNLPPGVYRRIAERYSCGHLRKVSFIERKIPTTIITSSAAAALAVSTGLRLGTATEEPTAQRLYLDTIGGALTRSALPRMEGCPCCGRYAGAPKLAVTGRDIGSLPEVLPEDATVTFSEPVLAAYRIGGEESIVFERASRFDSGFAATVSDNPDAVELEIRDQFTLDELTARFSGRTIPCKFAVVTAGPRIIVCEFVEKPV